MNSELTLLAKWYDDGLQLAKWSPSSKKIISLAFFKLRERLLKQLSPYCMHLKGRGGVKGSVRCLYKQVNEFPYVARLDINSYYSSINHEVLFNLLNKLQTDRSLMNIIINYVRIPDTNGRKKGDNSRRSTIDSPWCCLSLSFR